MEVQLHFFLTLVLDGVNGQPCVRAALPRGRSLRFPLNRRLCGFQSCSERFREETNHLPLPEFESRVVQVVAQSLRRLRYRCWIRKQLSNSRTIILRIEIYISGISFKNVFMGSKKILFLKLIGIVCTGSLLSHRACCYIYFIRTNSCTLFKTHSHSHLKH